jgi:uncharacterized membrane protein
MRLVHPLLLLSAVPVALAMLWLLLSRGTGGRPWAVLLRCLSLALIVLALAQPQVGHGSGGPVTLALDRSLSIGPGESHTERAWLQAASSEGCGAGCPVVQFAGVPKPTASSTGLLPVRAGGPVEGSQTDLQGALGLALAHTPAGGRVVLLSDGQQTRGEASAVAAQARTRHVRVDVVPLRDRRADAAITRLEAPQALHAGDPFSLEFTIASTVASVATVALKVNGVPAGTERVHLAAGETPYALHERAPATPGSDSYEVSVSIPGDQIRQNDALATTVRVERQPQVLVAGAEAGTIAAMLGGDGISTQVVAPQSLPSSAGGYTPHDALVLSDVSASELGEVRAEALDEAVRAGTVGLLALGGPNSYSLGRYYESPLQRVLPVSSLVPGNVKGSIALQLVLDHSGSMIDLVGEYPKLEAAQTASRAAAQFLAQHEDYLGVVAFNIKPTKVVPLGHVTKGNLHHIEGLIDGLQAEGGTNIYKGLAAGVSEIERSHAPNRHILLMTDGVSEEPGGYKKLLPQLHKDHIAISTIALGEEADTKLLYAIAKETHGNYYHVTEGGELPHIFSKETRRSARSVRLHGTIAVSAGESSPILESVSGRLPSLHGNVVTRLKQGAQVDLLGQDTSVHGPDPVLAQWQYGVGRVVSWTPGLSPEWAGEWARKASLWRDAVRWVERGVGIPVLTPVVAPGNPQELLVDPVRNAGVSLDLAQLSGSLTATSGRSVQLSFTQTAPSIYVAQLPSLAPGTYGYAVSDGLAATSGELALPYPAEYRPGQASHTQLGPLAAATGGQVLAADDESSIESSWTALWPWLTLLALLCFLADVVLRIGGGRPPTRRGGLRERPARRAVPRRTADRAVVRS